MATSGNGAPQSLPLANTRLLLQSLYQAAPFPTRLLLKDKYNEAMAEVQAAVSALVLPSEADEETVVEEVEMAAPKPAAGFKPARTRKPKPAVEEAPSGEVAVN